VFSKTSFSCYGCPEASAALDEHRVAGRDVVIVIGVETHVCVLQTIAHADIRGAHSIILSDAVASRFLEDYNCALENIRKMSLDSFYFFYL